MNEMLIEVEGHEIAVEQFGLASKVIAGGQNVLPLTHTGRTGVMTAIGGGLHQAEHQLVLDRCTHIPLAWAFEVKGVAIKSLSVRTRLEDAFARAYPGGVIATNARLGGVGFLEAGFFDELGNLCMLIQKPGTASARLDAYVTTSHHLALMLAALHPVATPRESSLSQIDDTGAMETWPLDVSDKSQVRGCIRDLDLDLRDADLCTRYGLGYLSDLTLEDLLKPNSNTPDF